MSTILKMRNTTISMRIYGFIFAIILNILPTWAQETREQFRDSLKAATELLAYHPDSTDLQLRKAGWNIQLEQWDYAKNEYDKILAREPYNLSARYYRAFVNEKLHRYPFARLDYEAVLTIVPSNFEALLGIALLNQKDGRQTEAYNQINQLVAMNPDSAVAYAARAGIEKERQMFSLAENDYEAACQRDPSNVDYRLNRVELLVLLKRPEEARAQLDILSKQGVAQGVLVPWYRRIRKK